MCEEEKSGCIGGVNIGAVMESVRVLSRGQTLEYG